MRLISYLNELLPGARTQRDCLAQVGVTNSPRSGLLLIRLRIITRY